MGTEGPWLPGSFTNCVRQGIHMETVIFPLGEVTASQKLCDLSRFTWIETVETELKFQSVCFSARTPQPLPAFPLTTELSEAVILHVNCF